MSKQIVPCNLNDKDIFVLIVWIRLETRWCLTGPFHYETLGARLRSLSKMDEELKRWVTSILPGYKKLSGLFSQHIKIFNAQGMIDLKGRF